MNSIVIQTISELKIYFRDKLQVFFGFLFPVFIIIICASIFSGTIIESLPYIDFILPGVFAILIMATSFFTVGASIAGYKENLIMKKLYATPMKLYSFLLSVILSRIAIIICQVFIMWLIAFIFFKSKFEGNLISFLYTFTISSILFLTIGFTIASITSTFNSAIGIANSFYMGLAFVSAAFYPITNFPQIMIHIIRIFPLINIVEPLRRAWNDGSWMPFSTNNIIVILSWFIICILITKYKFKWE
jgi:ABC-2 type transport system permease protein